MKKINIFFLAIAFLALNLFSCNQDQIQDIITPESTEIQSHREASSTSLIDLTSVQSMLDETLYQAKSDCYAYDLTTDLLNDLFSKNCDGLTKQECEHLNYLRHYHSLIRIWQMADCDRDQFCQICSNVDGDYYLSIVKEEFRSTIQYALDKIDDRCATMCEN